MKFLVGCVVVSTLLAILPHIRAQAPDPADQRSIKELEAEKAKLSKRLAEIEAELQKRKGGTAVTLRYLLPVQDPAEKKSSAVQWGVAAPVVDGFSDPNLIVYDQAYMERYVHWAVDTPIACGEAMYLITAAEGVLQVSGGLDESYLGQRFRADDLLRFLRTRTEGKTVERTFRVEYPEAVRVVQEHPQSLAARRLRHSPWERDTLSVVRLLSLARYKQAHPLFQALLKDPSLEVRTAVVLALGRIAAVVPEAIKDLTRLLPDLGLGSAAADGLTMAGGVAVPALIEAMNHQDAIVNNRAVFALARLHPFGDAVPGLLAALEHRNHTIRKWALSVVIDLQGRGVTITSHELIDTLGLRLADGDDEIRLQAAIALVNLKEGAARARPALLKAAEDPNSMVGQYAREALKAIDAATPRPK
jgi:HEAT repeat protein